MKKHILLIEDDEDDLKSFLEAMQLMPGFYKCTYTSCPAKGLNMLQYLEPDYIFIDYNLPGMNGLDVLREIKKDMRLKDTPAFLYTSLLDSKIEQSALDAGAIGCFQKPSTVNELVSIFDELLSPVECPTFFMYARDPASAATGWIGGNNHYHRG